MSSFENFIGSFMGLPESDRRKFVEIFQKLSYSNDNSTNNVDELDLPSGSHVYPETPSSLPEVLENENKKSPMKQNTLDKWLLKSKAASSKESDETSKTLQDENEGSPYQYEDPVFINDSTRTANKPSNDFEIVSTSKENSPESGHSDQGNQLMLDKFPLVVLHKMHLDDVVMESYSTEADNNSEASNSSFSIQNPHITENRTADPVSTNDINNSSVQDINYNRQFEEQSSTLKDLPHVSEYSSKLRERSRKSKKPSTESIHPLDKCSKVSQNVSNLHLERSKISVLSKKPTKETKSLITLEESHLNDSKSPKTSTISLKESSLAKDDWDEIIESVVKNVDSVPESDSKEEVSEEISKGSPKKKTQYKLKKSSKSKSTVRNLPAKKEEGKSSNCSQDLSQGPEQVSQIQKEVIDKVIDDVITENITCDSHSKYKWSSKLKESNTKVYISRLEKLTVSPTKTENVEGNSSLNEKMDVLNDPPRRSKRTLFPKDPSSKLPLDQKPCFSKNLEVPIVISNSETDMPEVLSSVTECSKKPRLKKQAILKTKTSAKRKRSLDREEVSTSEKLEKCVKFCSSPDQQNFNTKAASPKPTNEDPTDSPSLDIAPNVAVSLTPKIKRKALNDKSRSSQRKTTPKKCIKSKNEVECHQISDNLLMETHEKKDLSDNPKFNKNVKSNSGTFKENQSISKVSNNSELLLNDCNNQISLEKSDVSSNELPNSSKKVLKKDKKAKNVKLLSKNAKNIEITVSSGSKKKISLTESTLKPDVLNSINESKKQRKSFLKFAASNPDSQNSNSIDTGNCSESLPINFDSGLSVDPSFESNSSLGINKKVKRGSKVTLSGELNNIVVTIHASAPVCEDSVPPSRKSKRIISMKSDSPRKLSLESINQDESNATNINEPVKQASKEDSSSISSKKETSIVHPSIPLKKLQSKRKRLNSIIENLSPVPLDSRGYLAQDCSSNAKDDTEASSMQVEEPIANSTSTLNNLLDCSIGMTGTLGLSQKQLNYEAYDEVNRLCSSIGLNADDLFQISEIVNSIKTASSEDLFIIRGHKLPSGVIVPSVCRTDDLKQVLTNYEISNIF